MDKRGLGVTDYNGMVTKALGCRPPTSKESSVDRPTFLDKVWTGKKRPRSRQTSCDDT